MLYKVYTYEAHYIYIYIYLYTYICVGACMINDAEQLRLVVSGGTLSGWTILVIIRHDHCQGTSLPNGLLLGDSLYCAGHVILRRQLGRPSRYAFNWSGSCNHRLEKMNKHISSRSRTIHGKQRVFVMLDGLNTGAACEWSWHVCPSVSHSCGRLNVL